MVQDRTAVFVETSARLHFGVLDLRETAGRWFGGLGAPAPGPRLVVSAAPAATLTVEGEDAGRAAEFAARYLRHQRISGGARVRVHQALPPHSGLGSGTQLALAVARALAEAYARPTDVRELTRAVGRGRRSAVGTWTFDLGGLVVEGGRRPDRDGCAPLIAQLPLPADWRCVVAIPAAEQPGLSGAAEDAAFGKLPCPAERDVEKVAYLVLMVMLPAAAEGDLAAFGRALTEVQEITGRWFATLQGGAFAQGPSESLIRQMHGWGACGVGQSSWGPAVYGIVSGAAAAARLAAQVRSAVGDGGLVFEGAFPNHGARVWRDAEVEASGF